MLRLSKKIEYGLIALRHLALLPDGESATAREIAEEYGIPADLCAKILSLLSKSGLARATEGMRGGYSIARAPAEISVHTVILAIEGEQHLTECMEHGSCALHDLCTIKDPLRLLQEKITRTLTQTTIAEMIEPIPNVLSLPAL
ncbi:MAG TPA: Rrf2 family transcriptional regulator [Candidatus Kapabacteria bacterium]|nr:Rrf2 family transcriptional regulator [Candidatus Kapabacteria bacterium]